MNKAEFIKAVAAKADLSIKDATAAVEAYAAVVAEALKAGDTVAIANFASYELKEKAERHRKTICADKASLVFALPHEEGCLSQVLSILSFYKINLTKIQSLPIIGHEWEYLFYVDITFDDYIRYKQSIEAIRPLTKELKVLGEYKDDKNDPNN